MLTRDFRERSTKERIARESQALAEVLGARELREFPFTRHCEIGPFVVECLFAEQGLIVELAASEARLKFLTDMGYRVLAIDPRELVCHPRRVLKRLRGALEK
jgi:very-short-patch-repair endonuclease